MGHPQLSLPLPRCGLTWGRGPRTPWTWRPPGNWQPLRIRRRNHPGKTADSRRTRQTRPSGCSPEV